MCFFKDFIKNPQNTIVLTFYTHIISGIDGVNYLYVWLLKILIFQEFNQNYFKENSNTKWSNLWASNVWHSTDIDGGGIFIL